MAKKKKKRRRPPRKSPPAPFTTSSPSVPRRFIRGLAEAEALAKDKHWAEARDVLEALDRRYPGQPALLVDLVNAYYELGNIQGYQSAIERLLEAEPDNADATLSLAGAYLTNMRPALALRTFRAFVERWPDHERAPQARKTMTDLETTMPQILAELGLDDDEAAWELAAQHEEMQVHLAQGRFPQAHQTAQAILRRHPHFAPAHNNLSLAHWTEGHLDRAIESAEQVLTFEPDNVHALSNLVHFLCLQGHTDRARAYAERLRASTAPASDKALKQMEAFTYLGDDEAVLALFEQSEGLEEAEASPSNPVRYHLAAVAALRLGREEQARRWWKQALKLQRGFELAKENLDDLRRPVGERHAPWPFTMAQWMGPQAIKDLDAAFRSASPRQGDKAIESAARRYLKSHPEMALLLPLLLERGDPEGRTLAVMLIRLMHTPELLETLKAFALGPHGPDQVRIEVANLLCMQDVLPSGGVQVYVRGERTEVMLIGFEIGDESEEQESLPPRVEKLAAGAALALREGDWGRAEQLINAGLALKPDALTLLNNRAAMYEMQGREDEAHALVREIHARHPDYLFARVSLARMATMDGDLERAHELLDPLLSRKKLHFSEFENLCMALIDLCLAEDNRDAACAWFEMWESTDPDNPKLMTYRVRLSKLSRGMQRLFRR
jgi:tetratricopeptide (TPR) repeat protein